MKKINSLFVVLLLMLASFTAGVQYQRGDVDHDGQVGISDVTCLIDYLLNGKWGDEPVTPDGHEYVDLGLPSGTLWATCNIGANSPEEYGYYFAWGETQTEPREVYNWSTYKWSNGSYFTLTKYCTKSNFGNNGFVDNKTELDPEDDAAYVNWGDNWRMPTYDQQTELLTVCTWTWTTRNGVNGRLVIGPNGNTIFLPAAGFRFGSSQYSVGSEGDYWSRTLNSDYTTNAYSVYFNSEDVNWDYLNRSRAFTVRAVRASQD